MTRIESRAEDSIDGINELCDSVTNSSFSLVADLILNAMNAGVECDGVILDRELLLNQCVDLLLEEVDLIYVVLLQLLEVLLKVRNVLNDLLQDVIRRLGRMMLESGALGAQELHFLLVIVEKLDGLFCPTLFSDSAN